MNIKNCLLSFKSNPTQRTLLINFISLSVLQVFGFIFPLITMPYLSSTIGVEGFGKIAFGASVIAYFQTIVDWGFKYTAVRDISKNREHKEYVSMLFSAVIACRVILMAVSVFILLILIATISVFRENCTILIATFLLIPGYIIFPDWLFQAYERMTYITVMNFCSKLLFTLLVFVFVKTADDYFLEPILTAMGYLVSGLIALYYALKKFNIKFVLPSWKVIVTTITDGWNVFLTQFIPNLYNNLSVILLNYFGTARDTGLYSAGYKFINISDQFSGVLSRTFYPFLARRMDKHSLYVKISGLFSLIMGGVLFISSDLLVSIFYTPEFSDASTVIRVMSIAPFFLFLMNAYGTNGLMLIGKEKLLRKIILYTSLFGLVLSIIAVYKLSYIGVAITLISVWGIRGVITWYFARKNNIK